MNVFSFFSIVGLLAALGLGPVSSHQAFGGAPTIRAGAAAGAAAPRGAVMGTKAGRRPLDTVGGTPA